MTSSLKLCLAGAALVAVASAATAAELRLSEVELDQVTAGEPGIPVISIGNNTDFAPFPSTTFGEFDLFEGPLSPPPPPPPVVNPPSGGGGGGNPIQNILSILLGLGGIFR
jgi:hypothetical protein